MVTAWHVVDQFSCNRPTKKWTGSLLKAISITHRAARFIYWVIDVLVHFNQSAAISTGYRDNFKTAVCVIYRVIGSSQHHRVGFHTMPQLSDIFGVWEVTFYQPKSPRKSPAQQWLSLLTGRFVVVRNIFLLWNQAQVSRWILPSWVPNCTGSAENTQVQNLTLTMLPNKLSSRLILSSSTLSKHGCELAGVSAAGKHYHAVIRGY